MDYLLLALSWALFYSLHSIFAASKLKRFFRRKIRSGIKWYRLFYSIGSTAFILGILIQSILIPAFPLFAKGSITDYIAYVCAGFGTIIFVKSTKQISIKKFLGLTAESNAPEPLVTSGIYSKIRHPLYAGLFLIFTGYLFFAGTLAAVVHLGCLVCYLPIGIYFEEKNLRSIYGEAYQDYQSKVPPILPWI